MISAENLRFKVKEFRDSVGCTFSNVILGENKPINHTVVDHWRDPPNQSYRSRPLFSQLSKFNLCLAFICLMLLRVVVGYHFFKEGTTKLDSGNFSSYGFLAGAKGPLAPYFKMMLDDPDGMKKLCIAEKVEDGQKSYSIDAEITKLIWIDFADQATDYFGFGSEELEQKIAERRDRLKEQIAKAREEKDTSVNTVALEAQRKIDEQSILRLRQQPQRLEEILKDHESQLVDWLSANEVELISHFNTADRLDGFERDGDDRSQAALYVDSLRYQVDTIRSDRSKKLAGWTSEVTGIWDSLEGQINGLAVDEQAEQSAHLLHRPFDQKNSFSKWIDATIPWFDTIVGVLLIVGLLTRFASMAAALFLVSCRLWSVSENSKNCQKKLERKTSNYLRYHLGIRRLLLGGGRLLAIKLNFIFCSP